MLLYTAYYYAAAAYYILISCHVMFLFSFILYICFLPFSFLLPFHFLSCFITQNNVFPSFKSIQRHCFSYITHHTMFFPINCCFPFSLSAHTQTITMSVFIFFSSYFPSFNKSSELFIFQLSGIIIEGRSPSAIIGAPSRPFTLRSFSPLPLMPFCSSRLFTLLPALLSQNTILSVLGYYASLPCSYIYIWLIREKPAMGHHTHTC